MDRERLEVTSSLNEPTKYQIPLIWWRGHGEKTHRNPMPDEDLKLFPAHFTRTKSWLQKWTATCRCLWRRLDFLWLFSRCRGNFFIFTWVIAYLVIGARLCVYICSCFSGLAMGTLVFDVLCIWAWRYTLGMSDLYIYTFIDLGFLSCLSFLSWGLGLFACVRAFLRCLAFIEALGIGAIGCSWSRWISGRGTGLEVTPQFK